MFCALKSLHWKSIACIFFRNSLRNSMGAFQCHITSFCKLSMHYFQLSDASFMKHFQAKLYKYLGFQISFMTRIILFSFSLVSANIGAGGLPTDLEVTNFISSNGAENVFESVLFPSQTPVYLSGPGPTSTPFESIQTIGYRKLYRFRLVPPRVLLPTKLSVLEEVTITHSPETIITAVGTSPTILEQPTITRLASYQSDFNETYNPLDYFSFPERPLPFVTITSSISPKSAQSQTIEPVTETNRKLFIMLW